MKSFLLGVILVLSPIALKAEDPMFFSLSGFYWSDLRSRTSSSNIAHTLIDVKLAWPILPSLYFGLLYGHEEEKVVTSDYPIPADNLSVSYIRTSYGPFIGLVFNYVYLHLIYHAISEWKVVTPTTTSYYYNGRDGAGFQADLGFKFPISDTLHLGAQLSYKAFTYKVYQDAGGSSEMTVPLKSQKFDPLVSLWIFF